MCLVRVRAAEEEPVVAARVVERPSSLSLLARRPSTQQIRVVRGSSPPRPSSRPASRPTSRPTSIREYSSQTTTYHAAAPAPAPRRSNPRVSPRASVHHHHVPPPRDPRRVSVTGSGRRVSFSERVEPPLGRRSTGSVVYVTPASPRRSGASIAGRESRERVVVRDERGRRREYYR